MLIPSFFLVVDGSSQSHQLSFVCKACSFKFDLDLFAVYFDVARFGEGDVVLDPSLTEGLSDHLLEDFACVVLAGVYFALEEALGAKHLRELQ